MKDKKVVKTDTTYTLFCPKCKKIEDEFNEKEKPEDFGWFKHRNKWYCPSCSNEFK